MGCIHKQKKGWCTYWFCRVRERCKCGKYVTKKRALAVLDSINIDYMYKAIRQNENCIGFDIHIRKTQRETLNSLLTYMDSVSNGFNGVELTRKQIIYLKLLKDYLTQ